MPTDDDADPETHGARPDADRPDRDRPDADPETDIWIPARQAALVVAKPERWLREECRAGHLPHEGEPRTGQVFLVPMTATENLADHPPPDPSERAPDPG
jgi:hypothetical protein